MKTNELVIRRGADVVGPDGSLGTVSHVVVDEPTREICELVVRRPDAMEHHVHDERLFGGEGRTHKGGIHRLDAPVIISWREAENRGAVLERLPEVVRSLLRFLEVKR